MRSTAWFALLSLVASGVASAESGPTGQPSSIAYDAGRRVWTLANGTVQWEVSAGPGAPNAGLTQVAVAGLRPWAIAHGVDGLLTIDGVAHGIGGARDGFVFERASSIQVANGVELDVAMHLADERLGVTRHYALYDDSPALELWTTVSSLESQPHVLSDLNAFFITVPAGTAHWVNGLQGENADVSREAAFSMQTRTLNEGESMTLGSTRRSSEQQLPWMTVENGSSTFFAGLMWSGAWTLTATRAGTSVRVNAGIGPMQTVLAGGDSIDGPHALLGAIAGGASGVGRAVERLVVNGLRGGRPLAPLVTYNTWFAYGVRVDEASMRSEADRVAALGAELFVVDAGWYAGAGVVGPYDFESGLGKWTADPARFPSGLRALSDYVHHLGMRFGLWVEPERVNLSTIGASGVNEQWLATTRGGYQSDQTGQICLAGRAAGDWIFEQLTALIDDAQLDYLKWDNNFWTNCDRGGHGHGALDGNFAHTRGLYDLLGRLRERYPSLLIENVSGGGNRLDIGMLRYSDVAWMDDRTAPSALVRHNLEGLSSVLPPAYLLSFAVEHVGESLHQGSDLALLFRSRMGVLGLCFRTAQFSDAELAELGVQVTEYKSVRDSLVSSSAALLTPQVTVTPGRAWDALQISAADGNTFVIDAFQPDPGPARVTVALYGLDSGATYDVQSLDAGPLGSATGADLMNVGIELNALAGSAAHTLLLTRREPASQAARK
ncbi:MAG TPA: alpha-galactosidase [Vicinamibacterales bacterium]|nr:alpha-galactosidase [Vicinamibacterales bacterium]